MSQKEALKSISSIILDNKTKSITTEEFEDLIINAKTEEEENLYVAIYNCIIANKQKKVIADAKF